MKKAQFVQEISEERPDVAQELIQWRNKEGTNSGWDGYVHKRWPDMAKRFWASSTGSSGRR